MKLTEVLIIVAILLVVVLVPLPPTSTIGTSTGIRCLSNVKQSSLGVVMYLSDHDERLPDRDLWMDQLYPYLKNDELFRCPELPRNSFGYAFNAALSRTRSPSKDPEKVIAIYDSVNPTRNASDLVQSLPSPGRHKGRNVIGYLDGHAKMVETKAPAKESNP